MSSCFSATVLCTCSSAFLQLTHSVFVSLCRFYKGTNYANRIKDDIYCRQSLLYQFREKKIKAVMGVSRVLEDLTTQNVCKGLNKKENCKDWIAQ